MANPVGRPLKFQSVEELQAKIDAYFRSCHGDDGGLTEPYTITGLALALGTDRKTLCSYEQRDEFFNAIKTAKTRVENFAEKQLYLAKSATGAIFALKNFDWNGDTLNLNHGGQGGQNPVEASIKVSFVKPD